MPDWLQLTVSGPDPAGLEQALEDAGALAVTWQDAGDQPLLEPGPGETPLWSRARLTALFTPDIDATALLDELVRAGLAEAASAGWETLADRAWERECLKDLQAMRFGRRLWVCPQHDEPELPAEAVVLRLDPGLAFGTGTHPTTRLCLEWLDAQDLRGQRLIDYGCGSGILGLAALRLGAAEVAAFDHDPQALQASRDNAARQIPPAGLQLHAPDDPPTEAADIVIANILAGALIDLAPRLIALLRPGGQLILSGVLAEQAAEVQAAYAGEVDFSIANSEAWVRLDGRRFA